MLILFAGCLLVPPEEEPGYTPGTVTGTMARPMVCCENAEGELISDPISPNICDELCIPFNTVDWYAWANVQVVLTTWVDSEEVELATTVTDANGDYIFSDVPPDINYIITAIYPTDEEFVIKDVVEELVEGGTYDAGIADAESTVLALCLDGLGEIGLNSYLLDLDDFRSHDYYDEVIEEVCEKLTDCEHAIPLWVCVLTELCPGYTPTPVYTPTPTDPCAGNTDPSIYINDKTINAGDSLSYAIDGIDYSASDDGVGGDPNCAISNTPLDMDINPATGEITWTTACGDTGTYSDILVTIADACGLSASDTFDLIVVECTPSCDWGNTGPSISIDDKTINAGDSLSYAPGDTGYTASDDNTNGVPTHALSNETLGMSINSTTGEITWTTACGDTGTYSDILVTIADACGLSASDTFDLIVVECCESADLSSFSLEIKEGSSWNEYLGDIYPFESGQKEYYIMTAKNASHFRFTVTAECESSSTLEYNWYRDLQCGDSWLTGESGYSDPPLTWIPITSGGTYPTDTNDRSVCHKGGNVLFIKVTNAVNTEIYKVYVE